MKLLMDTTGVGRMIGELADRLVAAIGLRNPSQLSDHSVALVGIRSRGEILAQRLAAEIQSRTQSPKLDVGALDITMYRDDLASGRAIMIPRGTEMNFRLDGRTVILVDDVLQSGRSVRAALDALVDFGRPRFIRLAVLVDRGLREFPIAGDYVGMTVDASDPRQQVVVHLKPTDSEDAVYLK